MALFVKPVIVSCKYLGLVVVPPKSTVSVLPLSDSLPSDDGLVDCCWISGLSPRGGLSMLVIGCGIWFPILSLGYI